MSETASSSPTPATTGAPAAVPAELEGSCRLPLLALFLCGAAWLVISSVFELIASIKFHSPSFLADCPWLTYGRVRPAATVSILYGFCIPAGLGVTLRLLVRLGGGPLALGWLVILGAALWNLACAAGVLGILAGHATGFEYFELPQSAALLLFMGCLFIGISGVVTFHQRRERPLSVSHWFLVPALFWLPWIHSTATMLLLVAPVRGVGQAAIAWWYAQNLLVVWFGLVGLGLIFFCLPRIAGRELHNRYLALFAFWLLLLCGGWGGTPPSAPVPAWMPALSTVANVMTGMIVLVLALSVHGTFQGNWARFAVEPIWRFIGAGLVAFLLVTLWNAGGALSAERLVRFTWLVPAKALLNLYGFFTLLMFGAVYTIVPRLFGRAFPWGKLVPAHFWLAVIGLALVVAPLALGGVVEGLRLRNASLAFTDVAKSTLMYLRLSTVGELLLAVGHGFLLANVAGLAWRFYGARAQAACEAVTADLFQPEGAKS